MEFALLLPFLLTLALVCVDFGRALYYYTALTNAARAGAGYASANPYPYTTTTQANWQTAAINAATNEFAANAWFNATKVSVTVSAPTNAQYTAGGSWPVTVTVSYPFKPLINWKFLSGYYTSMTLTRRVVMQGTI
jgi:Flp pilus assembly protein TadG